MPKRTLWTEHPSYPHYEVADIGAVRNTKTRREIDPQPTHGGVLSLQVVDKNGVRKTRQLKRLVLEVYPKMAWSSLTNPVIAHYDGDVENCRQDNLYWSTRTNQWSLKDPSVAESLYLPMKLINRATGHPKKFETVFDAARWKDICPVQTLRFGWNRDVYGGYEYGFL